MNNIIENMQLIRLPIVSHSENEIIFSSTGEDFCVPYFIKSEIEQMSRDEELSDFEICKCNKVEDNEIQIKCLEWSKIDLEDLKECSLDFFGKNKALNQKMVKYEYDQQEFIDIPYGNYKVSLKIDFDLNSVSSIYQWNHVLSLIDKDKGVEIYSDNFSTKNDGWNDFCHNLSNHMQKNENFISNILENGILVN